SAIPAPAITSTSPIVWQVMPRAPAEIWALASSGILCVLMCGLRATPRSSQRACMRRMFASITSRSIVTTGVSSRSTVISNPSYLALRWASVLSRTPRVGCAFRASATPAPRDDEQHQDDEDPDTEVFHQVMVVTDPLGDEGP